MRFAIEHAKIARAQTSPNPLVGAVVVRDGIVVGQGAHLRTGDSHAEVYALNMSGEAARGATIYVTLEPCDHFGRTPPCTEAIVAAGICRVVVASVDHDPRTANQGIRRLREAGLEVVVGVLEEEANDLNRAFFHRIDNGRPLVVFKTAMTLSGHVAATSGHSQYVTGDAAREDVQRLRSMHPSVAVGVETVIADNPRLTIRQADGTASNILQPMRIIFDSRLRIPKEARLLRESGRTVVMSTHTAVQTQPEVVRYLEAIPGVELVPIVDSSGQVNLVKAMMELGKRGFNSMLLEGGPTLASAFFSCRLVDEIQFYIAPKILLNGLPTLAGASTQRMSDAIDLTTLGVRTVGDDLVVEAKVVYR